MNSLRKQYQQEILPRLKEKLSLENDLAVPRLLKITVNTSSTEFRKDEQFLQKTKDWLSQITGQVPKITRARTSIAAFDLRQGDVVGLAVTLRGDRMYIFFQKLVNIVLPRTKDFQGVKNTSFQQGSYTLGFPEQLLFPEVEYDKIGKVQGLELTITTSARQPQAARELLAALGMPFAKQEAK